MVSLYIISLLLLITGGLLCYMGIKLYKIAQMIFCGAIGGYLGLMLVGLFSRQEFYILALVLTVLGTFLGYKYYKYSLYLCLSVSSFLVTFSYFWKQAVDMTKQATETLVNANAIIVNNLSGNKSLQGTLDSFDAIRAIYNSNWGTVIAEAGEIIKHGAFVSAAVALVAGVLAVWIGDYVIMAVSAAFGSMILAYMVELYIDVTPMMHLLILVVVGLSGIIVQYVKCGRR